MTRKVRIVDYDPKWKQIYKEEEKKIKAILADNHVGSYHIGSTVIKGAKAEPIIDILTIVKKMHIADSKLTEFIDAGYEYKGEYGVPERKFYIKGGENPTVHIHMFEEKNVKDIARFYAVSNYLASHKEERQAFESLKLSLAEQYCDNYEAYCKEKRTCIDELEEKAIKWQLKQEKLGNYMAMGMCVGVATGCALGVIFSQMILGICVGMLVGLFLGLLVGRKKVGK